MADADCAELLGSVREGAQLVRGVAAVPVAEVAVDGHGAAPRVPPDRDR